MNTTKCLVTVVALAIVAGSASAAFAAGTCTDISMTITFAAGTPSGGASALFGDGSVPYAGSDPLFAGGPTYVDGVGGLYAKFQVCNATNDLILNPSTSTRYLNFDFTRQIPGAPADPTVVYQGGTVYNGGPGDGFFNINEVYNSSLYAIDPNDGIPTFQTCMGTTLTFPKKGAHTLWKNINQVNVVPGCDTQGGIVPIANQPYPAAIVEVKHPDSCTWVIRALSSNVANGTYTVAGLVESAKNKIGYATGGQYDMPLLLKATLNTPGCTP